MSQGEALPATVTRSAADQQVVQAQPPASEHAALPAVVRIGAGDQTVVKEPAE